jgi:hypothetical protein
MERSFGRLLSYWAAEEHRLLLCKLSDLKSASDQLARRFTKSWATVIGVRIPLLALSSFLADRMAEVLRVIAVSLFGLLVCNCYDDLTRLKRDPGGSGSADD